ncbi:M48 family metallopeptidase [Janthinobacterium agaricidamnosum]|uniref:Peptidase M48 family protein n=1 Tax=Janthinobacterium agaricidamnosum NBRC 102515 = DSM 9628 TaxID=1349767 RepID=W0V3A0_9BURK|nr:M48 family metallopeptidase [Janthinobacterium agaricidamnosum]CDG81828.1 peptidase M48 family protein [Janthinobacterium agaricidamnosum NBRC 102515 = DSM 9628]
MSRITVLTHATTRTLLSPLLLALLLAGCSTPRQRTVAGLPERAAPEAAPASPTPQMVAAQETLGKMVMLQDRLYKVAAPLLINNADLCKTQARNLLGFTAKNKYSYPGEYADAAQAVLGYGDPLEVSGVLAGSGAARAGLRKGDSLIAAEGKPLPTGANAETQAAAVFGPLVASRATLAMTIWRNGDNKILNVPVTRACAFRVDLGNADNVNSYADGQRIMITRGMINFAQNDEAIAFVMAKDMAHNVLDHARSQRSAATVGSIIDNLSSVRPDLSMLAGSGGLKPMPQELDAAADSLALYMLARAGYNIDNAAGFWQKLAGQYPASVLNGYTANHPATAFRLAAINRTLADIKAKQSAKKPLKP